MNKQAIQDQIAVLNANLALIEAQYNQRKNQLLAQIAAQQAALDKLNATPAS